MKKKQGLKTLGDYRRVAKDSLFDIFLPPESKSTSDYDAIKTALWHSRNIINCSRSNFSEGDWWSSIYYPDTKYEVINSKLYPDTKYEILNPTLFECIKLMEFVKKYHEQSIDELYPDWRERADARIIFFTSAGLSSLEAAFDFVRRLGSYIINVLQEAYCKYKKECNIKYQSPVIFLSKTPAVDDLEINPVPDIIIKTWFDDIVTGMRSGFPKSDYSRDKVQAEFNSMERQLEYEWNTWNKPKKKRRKQKAKAKRKHVPQEPQSKPLPMTKWADVFGVSRRTIGRMKEDEVYPFKQVSDRKWTLPLSSLPAEYLQKYQQQTKNA